MEKRLSEKVAKTTHPNSGIVSTHDKTMNTDALSSRSFVPSQ